MNVASAVPSVRFSALLVENGRIDNNENSENSERGLGLERTLSEQGCQVRKIASEGTIQDEAIEHFDIVVIEGRGVSDSEVLRLVGRAEAGATILVATESTELAVKAARLGASTMVGTSRELAAAQIGQLLAVVDFKRRLGRHGGSSSMNPPSSGVVQRRSAPLPRDVAPEALDALIEATEALVPMHRFQRVYVDYALRRFGGNKVHTAAALGIDRRTIQRWARARVEPESTRRDERLSS